MARPTTQTPQDSGGGGLSGRIARARAAAGGNNGGRSSGSRPVAGASSNPPTAGSFYRESLAELRKVTWPSRQDAMNLTVAVIGMTVAMAIFLGLIDGGLDQIVSKILGA